MSWLTVEQNVAFGLKMKKKPKDVIQKEVAEVLEMVGLTKYKDYYPVELSTSMLQRVVIARAFAVKPDILLDVYKRQLLPFSLCRLLLQFITD